MYSQKGIKPYGLSLRKYRRHPKSLRLVLAKEQIHILYSLSCRSFDQIVHCSHHDDAMCPRIQLKSDIDVVTAFHPLCLRADVLGSTRTKRSFS